MKIGVIPYNVPLGRVRLDERRLDEVQQDEVLYRRVVLRRGPHRRWNRQICIGTMKETERKTDMHRYHERDGEEDRYASVS